ncbi:MAG: IS5 family transposase [Pyrinomonadaceae bacterium]
MARREELTDEQWILIEPLFDKTNEIQTRGRPRRSAREVLNGVLWILRSGARWADLPDRFPPYQTCHRRFQHWVKDGTLKKVLETLAEDLYVRGKLDLSETSIDGTFASAKKGAFKVGKTKRGKGTKLMAVADGFGLPLAVYTESASPHEVRLVERTICERFTDQRPEKMIGDKAYDSDPLDKQLQKLGIEMIAPHKVNRRRAKTQDGRKLRRYKRRWKIERLFAWLQNFRRIVVRYEYHADNYLGFVQLACMIILLRNYF